MNTFQSPTRGSMLQRLGLFGLAILIGFAAATASAQPYPNRPIRMIVPFPPGATTDRVGRLMSNELSKRLKQPVTVQNIGGTGGGVGTRTVIAAPADGYTLLTTTSAVMTVASQVTESRFDPLKELTSVAFVGEAYSVIAVNPQLPVKNLEELIAYSKKHPGALNYGSAGYGSMANIQFELLKLRTGLDIVHVPFRGGGLAITSAVAGDVQAVFDPAAMPIAQSGKLRPIAVHGPNRWTALPGVSTITESGVRNWDNTIWYGLVAAAGTPGEIVTLLNKAWNEAMDDPQVLAQLEQMGISPKKETPQQLQQRVSTEYQAVARILPQLKLTE